MPSGAKKRKAAKKKLQKQSQINGAHPQQGNDDPKTHDERGESDDGEVERETCEKDVGNNGEEGTEKLRLGEANAAETDREVKPEENFNDVTVDAGDSSREPQNVDASGEHRSSSSSSSEDDEVAVEKEKEKPVAAELEKLEEQGQSSLQEAALSDETLKPSADYVPVAASGENSVTSEVAYNLVEESIPVEESVKEVVSSPRESNVMTESVPLENPTPIEMVKSELKQNVDEVLALLNEKEVFSAVKDMVQDKFETKVVPIGDGSSGNSSGLVDTTVKDDESLLPQSSGVTTVDRSCADDNLQESENHKHSEEQPLVSSAPLPVRRTSWMNCCGLFEVLSGGSSR